MIEFISIGTIVQDLMLTVRGGQLTQSEPISKLHMESLVHQGRAILLKRDIDKNKKVDPQYIQQINALELEEVDESYPSSISTDYKVFRTKLQIPNLITLNKGPALTYVGTVAGSEIQFSPEGRSRWQQFKKYTATDSIAYMKDNYIYLNNDKQIRYISIRGVFQVPTEVSHLDNPNEVVTDTTESSPYPIPISLLPALKEIVLKQLGIEANAPSDITNDSVSKVESNERSPSQ